MTNSYAPALAALRAAEGRHEQHRAKVEALEVTVAAIIADAAEVTAENDKAFRTLAATRSDLASYKPLNPYDAPLKALRAKEAGR